MADTTLYMLQTIVFGITGIICFITTVIVFNRDRSFTLNQVFASAILFLGFFNFSMLASNIPVLLYEEQVIVAAIQLAYSFLVLSLTSFLLSAFILQYGTSFRFRNYFIPLIGLIILIDLFVIWFTTAIIPNEDILGDITTSISFKIAVQGTLAVFYLITLYLFFKTYQETTGNVRKNVSWFLIGWLIGGLALIVSVLSDFVQFLDLIGPLLLAIAIIIQQRGFTRKATSE